MDGRKNTGRIYRSDAVRVAVANSSVLVLSAAGPVHTGGPLQYNRQSYRLICVLAITLCSTANKDYWLLYLQCNS